MKGPSILTDKFWFPPPAEADHEGLLAIGGDLKAERLLLAYRSGIFPWYDGKIPLWWNPDPRFVLFPDELSVSKSMKQVIKKYLFEYSRNKSFEKVISSCQKIFRHDQEGTWISKEIIVAYTQLHKMGYTHSFEAWQQDELVGGLYGVKMGNVFFGESMFSGVSNASKAAFIWAIDQLRKEGVTLIDCQVYTSHLESLGARFITRKRFLELLQQNIPSEK